MHSLNKSIYFSYSCVYETSCAYSRIPCRVMKTNKQLLILTETDVWKIDSVGFSSRRLISLVFRSAVQSKSDFQSVQTFQALLMMPVVSWFCGGGTGRKEGNVLPQASLERYFKKSSCSSILPTPYLFSPFPSNLSSIHLLLISSCCLSLNRPSCLPRAVTAASSAWLSGPVLDGDRCS